VFLEANSRGVFDASPAKVDPLQRLLDFNKNEPFGDTELTFFSALVEPLLRVRGRKKGRGDACDTDGRGCEDRDPRVHASDDAPRAGRTGPA